MALGVKHFTLWMLLFWALLMWAIISGNKHQVSKPSPYLVSK